MIQANSINSSYDTGVYRITDLIIFPGPKKSVKSDQRLGSGQFSQSTCLTSSKNTNFVCPEKIKNSPKRVTLPVPLYEKHDSI